MPEFNSASFYDWLNGLRKGLGDDFELNAERSHMTDWSRAQLGGSPVTQGPLDHPPIDPFADETYRPPISDALHVLHEGQSGPINFYTKVTPSELPSNHQEMQNYATQFPSRIEAIKALRIQYGLTLPEAISVMGPSKKMAASGMDIHPYSPHGDSPGDAAQLSAKLQQLPHKELVIRLNTLNNQAGHGGDFGISSSAEANAIRAEMIRRHTLNVNTPNLGPLDPPLGRGGAALTALGLRAGMSMDNFRTQKSSIPHFAASALAGAGIPRNLTEARGMWQSTVAPAVALAGGDPVPMVDQFANMASSMYDAATHPREIIQHLWENIKADPIGTAGFMTGALAGMVRGPKKIDARLLRNAEANAAAREAAAAGKIIPPEVPTVPAPETLAQPKLPFPDPATAASSAGIPSLEDEASSHAIAGRRALPLPQGINSMDDLRAALQGGSKLSPEYMDRSRAWLWGVLTPSQRLKLLNSRMGPMYRKLAKPGDLGEMGR